KVRRKLRERLQQLAAGLDTEWLAVVSRLAVENCQKIRSKPGQRIGLVQFSFVCDRRWEDLEVTGERAVRFCDACKQEVHYCDTILEARQHAWAGHCIATDLGVVRQDGDLRPRMLRRTLGRPSPGEAGVRSVEPTDPDPVSVQREQRKQEKEREG